MLKGGEVYPPKGVFFKQSESFRESISDISTGKNRLTYTFLYFFIKPFHSMDSISFTDIFLDFSTLPALITNQTETDIPVFTGTENIQPN